MKTCTIAAATLALGVFAQAGAQTYDLQFKPTIDAETKYNLSFKIDAGGQALVYKSILTNKIVFIEDDGRFRTVSYQTDHELSVDGQEQNSAAETITMVTTYDKLGVPLTVGGDLDTPESLRVAYLTSFLAPGRPVEMSEEWSVEVKEDPMRGARRIVHQYKLFKTEMLNGRATAVVSVHAREFDDDDLASAKGTVWIDIETGETVKYDAEVVNMPIAQSFVDGHVTIEKTTDAS